MTLMLRCGWFIMVLGGALLALGYWMYGLSALAIILPAYLMVFGVTFLFGQVLLLAR